MVVIEAEDVGTFGEDLPPLVAAAERAPGLARARRESV